VRYVVRALTPEASRSFRPLCGRTCPSAIWSGLVGPEGRWAHPDDHKEMSCG
jgi:hypothetical protein